LFHHLLYRCLSQCEVTVALRESQTLPPLR
jgi:hypothetical protein